MVVHPIGTGRRRWSPRVRVDCVDEDACCLLWRKQWLASAACVRCGGLERQDIKPTTWAITTLIVPTPQTRQLHSTTETQLTTNHVTMSLENLLPLGASLSDRVSVHD